MKFKVKVLLIAAVLAMCAHGALFAKGIIEERSASENYDTLYEQANAYIDADDFASAIPLLMRMHELKPGELWPVEALGNLYTHEDRPAFTNALFWLTEAEKRGSSDSGVYYNLACIYSLKGEIEKAEAEMDKAIILSYSTFEWISKDDDLINFRANSWWKGIADNYTQIEQQLALFKEYDEDEKSIEDIITFYSGIVIALKELAPNIPALQSRPLSYLASAYEDMENYSLAEQNYLEEAVIREKILGKEHPSYAWSLNSLGNLYLRIRDFAKVERYHLEALAIREKALGKEHPDYAWSLNNLAILYYLMGDYAKAERFYLEAAAIHEKALGKEHPDYAFSFDDLYKLYLSKKEYTQALAYKQKQIKINIGIVNKNFSFQSEQQRDFYWNANSGSFESAYSLSFYNPVPESNILNYETTLFSKGLLLRTANAVRDAIYSSGNQTLIAQFEELGGLRQQINALQQKDGNEEYIKSLETQAEALDKSITQSSAAFRELKADLAVSWQNVRDGLQKNEAAIEFVSFRIYDKKLTDTVQYAALVVKNDSKAPVWVLLRKESDLKEILDKAERRSSEQQARILYNANGLALFEAVWEPLEQELKDVTTVYYSPSGLLHKIAFNALPVDDSFKLLADKYNLNLVSSTSEVARLDRSPSKTTQIDSAVLYGGLDYNADEAAMRMAAQSYKTEAVASAASSAPPQGVTRGAAWVDLPATKEEVQNIQGYLNKKKIANTLYQGSMGNEESFMRLSGKKTGLIHLATHGFFLPDPERKNDDRQQEQQTRSAFKPIDNPLLRSGLLLAGGNHAWTNEPVEGVESGILTAAKIAGMNLIGTRLVVMSACQTGLGDVKNGEGVFGLQRAFKLAGVETLIMSLWEVSDEATALLMSTFYNEWLISGKSKQEAFKEAQRQVRAEYPAPFYWVAFVMMD